MRRSSWSWVRVIGVCLLGVLMPVPTAYARSQPVASAQTTDIRIPGTTIHIRLARTPAGSVEVKDAEPVVVDPLLVLTTEVTWDLYDIYVYELDEPDGSSPADAVSRPSKPYVPPDRGFGHDGYPAIGMTRKAAEQFCAWLSLKLGIAVRLPTEHEWIHLAQGGSLVAPELDSVAWYETNSEHSTHPVAQKQPNGFGLYDVLGNAAEWVMTDTRRPYAMGGGYRDNAQNSTATSSQKQVSAWNQSDPQIPKSQWWLADCSWVGFRFVIDATDEHINTLKELRDE